MPVLGSDLRWIAVLDTSLRVNADLILSGRGKVGCSTLCLATKMGAIAGRTGQFLQSSRA
jgi:hypothetical protein